MAKRSRGELYAALAANPRNHRIEEWAELLEADGWQLKKRRNVWVFSKPGCEPITLHTPHDEPLKISYAKRILRAIELCSE